MSVDFKNKLFQKALWGYAPEEVDEYISYVAGEYARLEKRFGALKAEGSGKRQNQTGTPAADIPGVSGPESGEKAEAERILSEARESAEREAASILEKSRREAEEEAGRILDDARERADAILREAEETRRTAEEERLAVGEIQRAVEESRKAVEESQRAVEESRRTIEAERAALEQERTSLEQRRSEASDERESADALRREAEKKLGESGRILAGLSEASARFRRDILAFSSSMESMARTQLSAAERFGEDADRFLEKMRAFSSDQPSPADEDAGEDPFGFAAAAAVIGEMLRDLPEDEPGEKETPAADEPSDEIPEDDSVPENVPDEKEDADDQRTPEPILPDEDADRLMAESAVSDRIAGEADLILSQLRELAAEESREPDGEPENGHPDHDVGEPVEAEPDSAGENAGAEPQNELSEDLSSEDLSAGDLSAEDLPGDEELEAVMAALSGISEDESYDAMLASFRPEDEVDPRMAEDLAKKRSERFRRMMDEAREDRKTSGGTDAGRIDAGESDLEKEIAAAVEAAVRADLDPEKALDDMLAGLTGEESGVSAGDVLEMLDFEEPGEDGAAYRDLDLEDFRRPVGDKADGEQDEARDAEDEGE